MNKIFLFAVSLALVGAGCTSQPQQYSPQEPIQNVNDTQLKQIQTYNGPSFSINYPDQFLLRETEPSKNNYGFDGVSFFSEDGAVEFYIFAPKTSGISVWENVLSNEKISFQEEKQEGEFTTTHITIADKNAMYTREITVYENNLVRYVFGFKYRSTNVKDMYQNAFDRFTLSLSRTSN